MFFMLKQSLLVCISLQWRHNEQDSVSNHQPHDCILKRLFGRRSKITSKLRVTGLCAGNSPGTDEFPAQRASNAENVSIWWRHHVPLHIWPAVRCRSWFPENNPPQWPSQRAASKNVTITIQWRHIWASEHPIFKSTTTGLFVHELILTSNRENRTWESTVDGFPSQRPVMWKALKRHEVSRLLIIAA